eukprot:CAMPEP_0178964738 /NCGR_PEP_ID=MMETSP0789-20121207/15856_1 /TAXON_ID=3005 /ORGANISM="Rhizosolenia setigera, Strain CCMP 1694" /LENGTH=539 /DNA_ID=CAMNT_0020649571 /DNA_START=462 /DNA_END=2081 /DNA_ORIENTATION=+
MGLKGKPFYLKQKEVIDAMGGDVAPFSGYFTLDHLEQAVHDDFLDATRGSTDNRKGWQVASVSQARGSSFEDAKMSMDDVKTALDKGTVIFNAIGAHIPLLAGATLACTDAASLPCASNLYVTAPNKRTSAPPHTDKQDVIVVQTEGKKHWRVYSPPNPATKPTADMFARGKGEDNLPVYSLEDSLGCELLLDVTLEAGDVLFIPAAFPHTTDTNFGDGETSSPTTSVHITFNFDAHVWELDYLSMRRLALRKAGITDKKLGQMRDEENRYVGDANLLPKEIRDELFSAVSFGFLDEDEMGGKDIAENVAKKLSEVAHLVDEETASLAEKVNPDIWKETTNRVREQGIQLFETHRDMYLAAIEEGELRKAEDAMTAHLNKSEKRPLTPERMQRLSLFRVKKYYDQVNESKEDLKKWSYECYAQDTDSASASSTEGNNANQLPDNWEFTLPVSVGESVEADLGGAFFPATITKAVGGRYDVQFFDGDQLSGLERGMIKLLTPPKQESDDVLAGIDTSGLTPKEIRRLRKKEEKKRRKRGN